MEIAASSEGLGRPVGKRPAFLRLLDPIVDSVLVLVLGFLFVVVIGNVTTRLVFGFSLLGITELTQLALITLAFVGAANAYSRGYQLSVDFFVARLPPSLRAATGALAEIIVFAVAGFLSVVSARQLPASLAAHSVYLGLSNFWFVVPFCGGTALIAVYALLRLVERPRKTVLLAVAAIAGIAAGSALWWGSIGRHVSADGLLSTYAAVFVVLIVIGVPIAFVLAGVPLLYLLLSGSAPLSVAPLVMSDGIGNFVLVALPFFVLAGLLVSYSGLAARIGDFVDALLGRVPGGPLHVLIGSMYLFSGVSGSTSADIVAVGSTVGPVARRQGYKPGEIAGLLSAAACMGQTVPPSISMLVLASLTQLSVAALFVAGFIPAAVMALCLMASVYIAAVRAGRQPTQSVALGVVGRAGLKAAPALLLPAILVGGLAFGIATATEISSFAVLYGLLLVAASYGRLNRKAFVGMLRDTIGTTGFLLFIVSAGGLFAWFLSIERVPQHLTNLATGLGGSPQLFMLAAMLVHIINGMAMEGLPALIIFVPILTPIAVQFGIDPLHFGMVMVIAMGFGTFLPPIGVGSLISCLVARATVEEAAIPTLRYLGIVFVGLLVVAFVPWFTLVLPQAMGLHK